MLKVLPPLTLLMALTTILIIACAMALVQQQRLLDFIEGLPATFLRSSALRLGSTLLNMQGFSVTLALAQLPASSATSLYAAHGSLERR